MRLRKSPLLQSACLAVTLAVAPVASGIVLPGAAMAATTLPAPYVSRALDAVLMPIDAATVTAFGLPKGSKGVLVLATQPGGLADKAGILPGDVIDMVGKKPVKKPIELDEIVYYWILQGIYDFDFVGLRAGAAITTTTVITLEYWEEVIDITTVESWSSYSYESFSYSEYYSEYSEEISVSYEESVTEITETVSSEEYSEEVTSVSEETTEEATEESTEEATDEATDEAADEATEDGEDEAAEEASDEECAGEVVDGVCEDAAEDEAADADEGDEAAEEDAGDEGGDEAAEDDAGDEDAGDEGGDEGGDDGGDEAVEE